VTRFIKWLYYTLKTDFNLGINSRFVLGYWLRRAVHFSYFNGQSARFCWDL